MKEQIGLYQQGDKTTIVIYNMKKSTKDKLFKVLLGDLKAEDDEAPVQEMITDLIPEMPDYDSAFYNPADPEPLLSAAVDQVYMGFDEDPQGTLTELLNITHIGLEEDRPAAAYRFGECLEKMAGEAPLDFSKSMLWEFAQEPAFAETILKIIRQKGCGAGITEQSPEYRGAANNALAALSAEELGGAVAAIAARYKGR